MEEIWRKEQKTNLEEKGKMSKLSRITLFSSAQIQIRIWILNQVYIKNKLQGTSSFYHIADNFNKTP